MKPAPNLHIVAQADPPNLEATRAASAAAGKHICDHMRAEILRRDWAPCHIAADKRRPIDLREPRRWGWR